MAGRPGPTSIAVTVNGAAPSISTPASAAVAQNVATAISGVSVSETGNTTTSGETFTVVVSDTSGVLSANTGASGGGGTIMPSSGETLTIAGTLAQVNADLTTLTDKETSTTPDTLAVAAMDSFGNSATKSLPLTVTPATGKLSISDPAGATIGVNPAGAIVGVSISEAATTTGETFTVTLSDGAGVLSANTGATGGGGTITPTNGGKTLTIAGTLSQVNADLTTLADTDATTASDAISVTASDSTGGSAGPASIAVTVNGAPSISAPTSATVAQNVATAISGVSVSESGNTTTSGETFTVIVSDSSGVLSANTGATGGGGTITPSNGSKTLTIAGTLSQVDADLTTLADDESSTSADTLSLSATDSFGNSATKSLPITVTPATVDTLSGTAMTLTENILFNDVTLADFTDSNLSTPASDLLAIINWSDGTQSTGKVTGSDGSFAVSGSHAFGGPGQDDATITLSKVGSTSTATVTTMLNVGVLLGDANGNGMTDPGEHTLFVPEASAQQLLNPPASIDLRVSMISEALQAQIKIDQGVADPGLQSAGFGLISDAVNWLLGDSPFVYTPLTGNVDTNHNGVLDTGATSAGFEYNTATESFTTPPVKPTMAAGLQYVDVVSSTPHSGDLMANGNDLKNALAAFNAGELVTLVNGTMVGWEAGGAPIDVQANTATGFLTVLKDQHVIAGPTHT